MPGPAKPASSNILNILDVLKNWNIFNILKNRTILRSFKNLNILDIFPGKSRGGSAGAPAAGRRIRGLERPERLRVVKS
jgi:hypothetical protein